MPSYQAAIQIDAEPPAVFKAVADLLDHGSWSADPLEVTAVTSGIYRSSSVSKGKTITADLTVVESDPPNRFVFDATDMTGKWRHTFTIMPLGTGSTVTREIAGKLGGAQLLLYYLVVLPIKKPNAMRALARLKQNLETNG